MKKQAVKRVPTKLSPGRRTAMAGQSLWNGTISFSLVAIPVHMVRAVDSGRVSFRMLHKKDFSPLQRRMFCPIEEKIVPPDEIVRGYEIGTGRFILITDEELASVSPERSSTIEISEFIDMQEVDPAYFDHPYYLIPAKGGEKAYQLLAEVLRRTERAGLAKFVMGEREYLVAICSTEGVLSLITLHYNSDIVRDDAVSPKAEEAGSAETEHAEKTIRKMLSGFDPEKYADRRRKKIMDILKTKMKKRGPVEAPHGEEDVEEGPADLVAALRESMRKVKRAT